MGEKRQRMIALNTFFFLGLLATFPAGCFSDVIQPSLMNKKSTHPTGSNRFGSSVVFPVQGNVYPLGYYFVNLNIGHPPKQYDLDIDTGSDLTWVQCDAPCTGCTKPRDRLYKPSNNVVSCGDPACAAMHWLGNSHCKDPKEQCDYEVTYADQGSSLGVLVKDYFPLRFTNGSIIGPRLAFGCGYDQKYNGPHSPPSTAGVLGLGNGKANIVSQLNAIGLTRNVVGHCLSGRGGGFLFFGDDLVPSSGVVWTPISRNSAENHYSSGPAELLFGGKSTGVKGLLVVFDSGSSYTYFNSQAYQATVNLIKKELNGKPLKDAAEDKSLSICWKGKKPFKSVGDVKNYFKPLVLSFTNAKNVQLNLPPEAYLIVTKFGNACLGILNGAEIGLGNLNIIGDISLQDRMVIYDNEKQQIGWTPANCDRLPNVDRDYNEGFSQPSAANYAFLAAIYAS
ncbi:aspartic proteinase Asp1-like isoform X1 [Alnus glutinosa]|uniref:aspartic proteinase Asp1-like isoform X1 n=1 Tax=Alnus glutinosa TaxID=3517 RepID=UPI002D785352|nr:aspartic proteinase Asp1-like isoform X1 [Alnus glutinosa]XP_062159392.1 aspartic proteinase Asp1-like isoform X1 [Alnus glutinosa]